MIRTISTPSSSPEHWRQHAACSNEDPEFFFPVADGPDYECQVAKAKAVCRDCPVRQQCLDEALTRIPEGVAGGMTAEERRASRREPEACELEGDDLARQARTRADLAAAGAALFASGRSTAAVARICGVSLRTAFRWRARAAAARRPGPVAS
jgi:hypothetical protein